jgi:hypothetical protein
MRAHAEFRRHRAADSPAHIIGFLSQWKRYLDQLPASPDAGGAFRGARMDPTVFEKVRVGLSGGVRGGWLMGEQMSQEQLGQMYELMHATKELWKPVDQLQKEGGDGSA